MAILAAHERSGTRVEIEVGRAIAQLGGLLPADQ